MSLNKITKHDITLPYTAQKDGIFWAQIRAVSTGRLYAVVAGIMIIDGYQSSSGYINGSIPVTAGTEIKFTETHNAGEIITRFYTFD